MKVAVASTVLGLIVLTSCGRGSNTVVENVDSLFPPTGVVTMTPVEDLEFGWQSPLGSIKELERGTYSSPLDYDRLPSLLYLRELFETSSVWPPRAQSTPLAAAILDPLRSRRGALGDYAVDPPYFHYRELDVTFFYVVREDGPWGVANPDTELDELVLNGPPLIPEASVRSYFQMQSYGNFSPSFTVITTPFLYGTESEAFSGAFSFYKLFRAPSETLELYSLIVNENSYLQEFQREAMTGIVREPILYTSWPGNNGTAEAYQSFKYAELHSPSPELISIGYVAVYLPEAWKDLNVYANEQFSVGTIEGSLTDVVAHEIGHLLSWPDTYHDFPELGLRRLEGLDLMDAKGFAPLGIHKVLSGWTCFIHTKYDVRPLVVGAQDVYEGKRELYFLTYNANEPGEFFYIENQAGTGSRKFGSGPDSIPIINIVSNSGLAIAHIDFTRDPEHLPYIEIPSNYLPDEMYPISIEPLKYFFPYVASSFDSGSLVTPKWSDGSAAEVAVRDIRFLDNKRYRAYLYRPWEDIMGYGDIICSVDVGNPLKGDLNGDGIVNDGDLAILKANYGKRVGVDTLAVPVDVNGDGLVGLVRDRDGDGFVSTSERIYDDAWELVHTTGDWLDLNADGRNDLDADGDGQWDIVERVLAELPESGITREYVASFFQWELYQASSEIYGGVEIEGASDFVTTFFDRNADGVLDFFDADLDGEADLVPQMLDPNGDGVVNELDSAYLGYFWGETTFEELWLPLPAPESWD